MIFAPNLAYTWIQHGFGELGNAYPEHVTTVKQIHSALVIDADQVPLGETLSVKGDALVSSQRGRTVAVRTADCVPLLLADSRNRTVAAIHAGWRGTAANIVSETLAEMHRLWGTEPADIAAAIGPSIGGCCYEVSPEVAERFGHWVPEWRDAAGPIKIDLSSVNQKQLRDVGVEDIWTAGLCTLCNPRRFWSFRGQGEAAGRMLSFIGLTE